MGTKKRILRGVWESKRPEEIELASLDPELTAENPELREVLLHLLESHGIQPLQIGSPAAETRRVVLRKTIADRERRKAGLIKLKKRQHFFHVILATCGVVTLRNLYVGFLLGGLIFAGIGIIVLAAYVLTIRNVRKKYGLNDSPSTLPSRSTLPPRATPPQPRSPSTPPPLRAATPPALPQHVDRTVHPTTARVAGVRQRKPAAANSGLRFVLIMAIVTLPILLPFLGYIAWMGLQKQAGKQYYEQHIQVEVIELTPHETQEDAGAAIIRLTNNGPRSVEQLDLGLRLTGEGIYPEGINKSVRFDQNQEETFTVPLRITNRDRVGEIELLTDLKNLKWSANP